MGFFSQFFGSGSMSAVVVVLDKQLPYGGPQVHQQMLTEILNKAGVKVNRQIHTILSQGVKDRSRGIVVAICDHYFRETLGSAYNADSLVITPFDSSKYSTAGVVVSHP